MKYFVQILGIYFLGFSLHLDAQNTSVIEGDNAQTGLSIQNAGLIGIHIPNPFGAGIFIQESGLSAGIFSTNSSSTLPGIEISQNHPNKDFHDIRLSGSKIIGSLDKILIQIDSDGPSFDENIFGIYSQNKNDPVFKVFSTGGIRYKGDLIGGQITTANTNDINPDIYLKGSRGIISSNDPDSDMILKAQGDILIGAGQNLGSPSKFAVMNFDLTSEIFSVNSDGMVKVAGTTVHGSDRNIKENIKLSSPKSILSKLVQMPIYNWNYKTNEIPHVGPMAQDFYAAFNIGYNDKTITAVDADGISLAAIKGLYELMQEKLASKSEQITDLQERLAALENKN